MLHLDGRVQCDSRAVAAQSHPQFQIFHGGGGVGYVEAAAFQKHIPANGAATCPKCGGALVAGLMYVIVQKITKLGDDAGRAGFTIVRTENGTEFRIVFQPPPDSRNRLRADANVGVQQQDHIAARGPHSCISAECGAAVDANSNDPRPKFHGILKCIVCRTIVHHDKLVKLFPIPCQTGQTLLKFASAIVNGNHNREEHLRVGRHRWPSYHRKFEFRRFLWEVL